MPAASLKVVHNTYRDSVTLMQVSAKIAALAGVQQASVVMATEGNLALLREAGLLDGEVAASPSDLLVVLRAEDEAAAQAAMAETERILAGGSGAAALGGPREIAPRSLQMGLAAQPEAASGFAPSPQALDEQKSHTKRLQELEQAKQDLKQAFEEKPKDEAPAAETHRQCVVRLRGSLRAGAITAQVQPLGAGQ